MGSTRDWAAEKEDEITYCRHGNPSKYFSKCMCRGCKNDRAYWEERKALMNKCLQRFEEHLKTLPDSKWEQTTNKIVGDK